MNNLFKFTTLIFLTLGAAWLAFVVGTRSQFGDLLQSPESLNEDGTIPEDADLYPMELSGSAQQGSNEYLALGCTTCHTQQVRLEEAGFDVERGWGDRPSVPRDYILQENILLGNTRVGPDLANLGLREYSEEWLHTHLFEPQSIDPQSICPPSPFLYEVSPTKKAGYFKLQTESEEENARFIKPSIRADRIISYLQALKQDYELPEMAFIEEDEEVDESANEIESTKTDQNASDAFPQWLADQMEAGKEVYMKAAPGGGLCFTCHQPTGLGMPGQFPPLAGSDWVLGDKTRLIKISIHGLMGEIEVNGVKYNNVMPPPGIPPGSLTDKQIADVLTYIRNSWGNSVSAVTESEVKNVRLDVKDRPAMQMWTAQELDSAKLN